MSKICTSLPDRTLCGQPLKKQRSITGGISNKTCYKNAQQNFGRSTLDPQRPQMTVLRVEDLRRVAQQVQAPRPAQDLEGLGRDRHSGHTPQRRELLLGIAELEGVEEGGEEQEELLLG